MNESYSDLDSEIQLSKDPHTVGFDLRAGRTWIYPTNYPVRDYQFNITMTALHKNTMVSLPTGLGKTFIAAVIMYNYYRWYPMGKVIFMAPTKPLVAQQMDACYNIMAIPPAVTTEMTGSKSNTSRVKIWKDKRVFFITPHILQNDIDTILELAPQIKCIVVDEAHRALGKNANCEVIRKIEKINTNFRVLALTATPGSNFNSIKDVITNLLISHIEVRTNESIDVAPYVFHRKLDTVVIPITGKLLFVKNQYIKILDTYTRPLLQHNVISGNCANLTKGRFVLTMKEFKQRGRQNSNYSFLMRNLNICITLYHAYELLIRHGLRNFLIFFEESISKPLINSIKDLHCLIEDIRNYLGPIQQAEMFPDGTIPEITGEFMFSHPKFCKLSEILLDHFKKVQDSDTRVMVFCEYRESVHEIYSMLLRHRPLVQPRVFLGQGSITQAKQLQTIRMFKSGTCNTLISTCIGEEGLDVGEVDLIVCFDISTKSPIRMVQRMGRTGRKRDGHVVVLVTEGKEQQLLSQCLIQKNNMTALLESQPIKAHLYKNDPKMIPSDIVPECNKMFITVNPPEAPPKKKKNEKQARKNTLKDMFESIFSSQSNSNKSSQDKNFTDTKSSKSKRKRVSSPSDNFLATINEISDTNCNSNSQDMDFTDAKFSSKNKNKKILASKGSNASVKKQSDIRNLFSNITSSQSSRRFEETTEEENPQLNKLIEDIKKLLKKRENNSACKICTNFFDCRPFTSSAKYERTNRWQIPSDSIFDNITAKSLQQFTVTQTSAEKPRMSIGNKEKIDEKTNLEKSLEFFMLDTVMDVFSDGSDDQNDCFLENPNLFNHSLGGFNWSMQSQMNSTPDRAGNIASKNDMVSNKMSPLTCRNSTTQISKNAASVTSSARGKMASSSKEFPLSKNVCASNRNVPSNRIVLHETENSVSGCKNMSLLNENLGLPKNMSTPNWSMSSSSKNVPSTSRNVLKESETSPSGCKNVLLLNENLGLPKNMSTPNWGMPSLEKDEDNDVIVVSDSDESSSPVLNLSNRISRTRKKTPRNLLSQFGSTLKLSEQKDLNDFKTDPDTNRDFPNSEEKISANCSKSKDNFKFWDDSLFEDYENSEEKEVSSLPVLTKLDKSPAANFPQKSTDSQQTSNKMLKSESPEMNKAHSKTRDAKLDKSPADLPQKGTNSQQTVSKIHNLKSSEMNRTCSKTTGSNLTNLSATIEHDKAPETEGKKAESDQDYDSDDTIILSFNTDGIFEEIHQENLLSQKSKSELPAGSESQQENSLTDIDLQNKNFQLGNSKIGCANRSVESEVNCSLLTVTQMIEYLNDSKNCSMNKSRDKNTEIKIRESLNRITQMNSSKSCSTNKNGGLQTEGGLNFFVKMEEKKIETENKKSLPFTPAQETINKSLNSIAGGDSNYLTTISHSVNKDAELENGEGSNSYTQLDGLKNEVENKYIHVEEKIRNESLDFLTKNNNTYLTTKSSLDSHSVNINAGMHIGESSDNTTELMNDFEICSWSKNTEIHTAKWLHCTKKPSSDKLSNNRNTISKSQHLLRRRNNSSVESTSAAPERLSFENSNNTESESLNMLQESNCKSLPNTTNVEMKESFESDEEFSLLSFSQNTRTNRHKRLKLQLSQKSQKENYADSAITLTQQNSLLKTKIDDDQTNAFMSQNSPLKIASRNLNRPIILSDSDDDFEAKPFLKPSQKLKTAPKINATPVKKSQGSNRDVSKKYVENPFSVKRTNSDSLGSKRAKKNPAYDFIEFEAEVEEDGVVVLDSDEEDTDSSLESSFISYTQNVCDQTDMQAKYLQSIKSPQCIPGGFKMSRLRQPTLHENVYSQTDDCQNDTYMNDSFCVGDDNTLSQRDNMSYLEIAEAELERKKKLNRKRKRIRT